MKDAIAEIDVRRKTLDVLTDGAVIKVNDFSAREKLGYTDKFPRWAIAFKFEAEEAITTVRRVVWQVGRTGKLTPLAEVDPVELAGATVRKATLNNLGDIRRKDIKVGSRVLIRRSNEVIPEILGACEHTGQSVDVPSARSLPVLRFSARRRGGQSVLPQPRLPSARGGGARAFCEQKRHGYRRLFGDDGLPSVR